MVFGDFNIHLDDPSINLASNFFAHFPPNNLILHPSAAIYPYGHTLDDIITKK